MRTHVTTHLAQIRLLGVRPTVAAFAAHVVLAAPGTACGPPPEAAACAGPSTGRST